MNFRHLLSWLAKRLTPPTTVRRGSLQYGLLVVWGIGLACCVIPIFRAIPKLSDEQLNIDPGDVLKRTDSKTYEIIRPAKESDDWGLLRRRLAEDFLKKNFEEFWGQGGLAAQKFRDTFPPPTRDAVDAALGNSDWSQNWPLAAEQLMRPTDREKLKAASNSWSRLETSFLQPKMLPDERKDKKRSLRHDYEKILVALCAPWLTLMISAALFGQQKNRQQQVPFGAAVIVSLLSLLFLWAIAVTYYGDLYGPANVSVTPTDLIDPVVALLASLVGTAVTFSFPEVRTDETATGVQPIQTPVSPSPST